MKYTDPSGQSFIGTLLIGALIGAVADFASQAIANNEHINWGSIFVSAISGMIGAGASALLYPAGVNGFLAGAAIGTISSSSKYFLDCAVNSRPITADFFKTTAIGAVTGGTIAGIKAAFSHRYFFTGNKVPKIRFEYAYPDLRVMPLNPANPFNNEMKIQGICAYYTSGDIYKNIFNADLSLESYYPAGYHFENHLNYDGIFPTPQYYHEATLARIFGADNVTEYIAFNPWRGIFDGIEGEQYHFGLALEQGKHVMYISSGYDIGCHAVRLDAVEIYYDGTFDYFVEDCNALFYPGKIVRMCYEEIMQQNILRMGYIITSPIPYK